MKARIPEFQEGLDFFCKNESWAAIYKDAPDGEKERLELKFYDTLKDKQGNPLSQEEYLSAARLCKTPMKKADWRYALMFVKDARQKAYYEKRLLEAEE